MSLILDRMCSRQLSKDEFDFIKKHYPEVHRLFAEHPPSKRGPVESAPEESGTETSPETETPGDDASGEPGGDPPPVPEGSGTSKKTRRGKK